MPKGPWQDLAIDILDPIAPSGDYVFVAIDYHSHYFEIDDMKTITSQKIIVSLTYNYVCYTWIAFKWYDQEWQYGTVRLNYGTLKSKVRWYGTRFYVMVRVWCVGTLFQFAYYTYQTYRTYWYGMFFVQTAAVNEDS